MKLANIALLSGATAATTGTASIGLYERFTVSVYATGVSGLVTGNVGVMASIDDYWYPLGTGVFTAGPSGFYLNSVGPWTNIRVVLSSYVTGNFYANVRGGVYL